MLPLRWLKVAILKWPIPLADSSKLRRTNHNLEKSDRKICHDLEKLARGKKDMKK